MPDFDPTHDYYSDLGLESNANDRVIRDKYKELVREAHPDRKYDGLRGAAAERTAVLNIAYHILHDPEIRKRYDASRAKKGLDKPKPDVYTKDQPTSGKHKPEHKETFFGNLSLFFEIYDKAEYFEFTHRKTRRGESTTLKFNKGAVTKPMTKPKKPQRKEKKPFLEGKLLSMSQSDLTVRGENVLPKAADDGFMRLSADQSTNSWWGKFGWH